MAQIKNQWLEKYEIKKPDYDYIERECVGMEDAAFPPARYVLKNGVWVSKTIKQRLFGKKKVRLMFVGDITCFEKQFDEAKVEQGYDFSYQLDKVRPIFAEADLVVGNLETMIFPNAPYRTEKYVSEQNFHCNAPIEFLDAVRKAGFDVLTNANNHDLDTGAVGIGETIDRVERFGFIQTGTFNSDKKRYEIIQVGDFKIALVAFATEHNNKRCNLTREGVDFLLNDYSTEKAAAIVADARADGAELVFVCIHWGKENVTVHNREQERIAEELVDLGYDCIIGSHPHVLQDYTTIISDDLKEIPVFYSMGNFLSHNVAGDKSRSVIACVDLNRIGDSIDLTCSYVPIYTSKGSGEKKYVVTPLPHHPLDPRNVRRKQLITAIMGSGIEVTSDIHPMEVIERLEELPTIRRPKPNLAKVKKFPITYDDGKFCYRIGKNAVQIESLSPDCTSSSHSVPAKVLERFVTKMKEGAFQSDERLMKINFNKNLTEIPARLCKDCVKLEGFQLGSKTTSIGEEAFDGCKKLAAAVMSASVTSIGSKAFRNCTALRSVKIPVGIQQIADDAFEGCPNVVFYCEPGSYGLRYAAEHKIKSVVMDLK